MKNLMFSKDDILLALLDIRKDSFARAALVNSLITSKISRLKSSMQFEKRKFNNDFGSFDEVEKKYASLGIKDKKKINDKIKKISSLINQINSLKTYEQELAEASYSNESLDKLESNVIRVFKWEKPEFYDDIFYRS